jgi:hypothetical protein
MGVQTTFMSNDLLEGRGTGNGGHKAASRSVAESHGE